MQRGPRAAAQQSLRGHVPPHPLQAGTQAETRARPRLPSSQLGLSQAEVPGAQPTPQQTPAVPWLPLPWGGAGRDMFTLLVPLQQLHLPRPGGTYACCLWRCVPGAGHQSSFGCAEGGSSLDPALQTFLGCLMGAGEAPLPTWASAVPAAAQGWGRATARSSAAHGAVACVARSAHPWVLCGGGDQSSRALAQCLLQQGCLQRREAQVVQRDPESCKLCLVCPQQVVVRLEGSGARSQHFTLPGPGASSGPPTGSPGHVGAGDSPRWQKRGWGRVMGSPPGGEQAKPIRSLPPQGPEHVLPSPRPSVAGCPSSLTLQTRASSYCSSLMLVFLDSSTS